MYHNKNIFEQIILHKSTQLNRYKNKLIHLFENYIKQERKVR